ncbi:MULTISPECIES: diguanylate cyclase [unclassified Brevundimonas]|uniref:GGDEF domain-containing protein n=1 Tax=unclassified Brevundimonas TaxID=2622653 RepID=UPI0006F3DA39|nr:MULTISPECIES: GGDEF domain-containing protein [unclassified Brevundimonas]KQY82924.1 diguanylate cyclase [Brevundimonas sp. Root1423]KRA29180.1 diguanylate cyclase [Brevundimonas sp. Root608]
MTAKVETTLRSPQAYGLARKVVDAMEAARVWPTPLNFELWTHALGEPESVLAVEIQRMTAAGEPFTEAVTEGLAAEHLPRGRLTEQIRDAGLVLDRELSSVSSVIAEAHRSQAAYGQTLDQAATSIEAAADGDGLQTIVSGLTSATRQAQHETESLEKKLEVSTQEIIRLRHHLELVRRDAMTDALTDLANRKAFDEQLAAACDHAETEGAALTLAVIDIDHFKRFNDTWGHQTGDQVLRYVASVLARVAANPRFAARYGGEEFALIFPYESVAMVEVALERMRTEIASRALRRRSTNDDLGAVTVSAGFAVRRRGETASAFLERADAALYASKRGGRNRVSSAERPPRAA